MKMNVMAVVLVVFFFVPLTASAQSVGNCGWGSKLFDKQRGIAPQVLAVTTNGTSGNQTFGITFGTSGCTQDGVVRSSWKTAMYIDANMEKLARDIAVGEGESLESLAQLLGVEGADRSEFRTVLKDNFSTLFASANVSSQDVHGALTLVLASNENLSKYAELS